MRAPLSSATLVGIARERATHAPDAVFCHALVGDDWQTITAAELWRRTEAAAHRLLEAGVVPGDIVLLAHRHDPDLYPAFLAAQLIGAIPTFMPFPGEKQTAARYWEVHQPLFQRLAPGAVIASATYLDELAHTVGGVCAARLPLRGLCDAASSPHPPVAPAPHAIALLQHSSGTTGAKKGVILTHAAILAQLEAYIPTLDLGDDACIASWLPLYHDMGLIACFLLPLVAGVPLVAIDPFVWSARPVLLLDAIAHFRATHTWLPNFAFQHLVRAVAADWQGDLASMRAFINCSEPCKPDTFDAFLARFARCGVRPGSLQSCYAMAETVFAVTQTRVGRAPRVLTVDRDALQLEQRAVEPAGPDTATRVASVGLPLPILDVVVGDAEGLPLPDGSCGEVLVRGTCLFDGYFRDPVPARQVWSGAWYRTGDIGFLDAGELFITGRRADRLIVNGRNVYAHDIEAIANTVPPVAPGRCVAIGVHNAAIGSEQVVVLAELRPADAETSGLAGRVRAAVQEQLGIAVTRVVPVPTGWLDKTTSGKISRERNHAKYLAEFDGGIAGHHATALPLHR